MHYNYKVKSVDYDEKTNNSKVLVAVEVSKSKETAVAQNREDITGAFLGPVPRETIENWLKSTVEPSDSVEITFDKGVKFEESVEKPLKTTKKSK